MLEEPSINKIKITVLTVVYNDERNIQKTLDSVVSQDYPQLEYIIIDGKSTDGTLKIVEKYNDKIDVIISESDDGIYDAMNKGTKLASGQYISYLHSGDRFYSSKTISNVFSHLKEKPDIIYGNYYVEYPNGIGRIENSHNPENLWRPFFNQQCAFYKKTILNPQPFEIKYNTAADFYFTMQCIEKGYEIIKINEIICTSLKGGYSNQQEFLTIKQYYAIIKQFGITDKRLYYYKKIIWIYLIENIVKRILPINVYYSLQNYFRKYFPIN